MRLLEILSQIGGILTPVGGSFDPFYGDHFLCQNFQTAWNSLKFGGDLSDKIKITYQTIKFRFGALKPHWNPISATLQLVMNGFS